MNDVYWDFHNLAKAIQLREHVHGSTGMDMLHIPMPSTKSLRQFHLYLVFTSEREGVLQCLAMPAHAMPAHSVKEMDMLVHRMGEGR